MSDIAEQMPWLNRAWSTMQRQLAEDRLPHAMLVSGDRGVGKRVWAEAVAHLLVCDCRVVADTGATDACGHCKQCELMAAGSHPDVRFYSPEKSRVVKVDQIRALSAFAATSPQVARHKVAIVDRADQLNLNAANALLKTLEEPQPDTTLILLQEAGRPVLPTIRSRCQAITVPLPSLGQGEQWLLARAKPGEDGSGPAPEFLRKCLLLAGNAPRLALEYAGSDYPDLRDQAFDGFRKFMKGQMPVNEAARRFKALGPEAALWLFECWAADLARVSAGGAASDPEAAEMIAFLATTNPPWRAHYLLDQIKESRSALVYNANPELEATRLLIAWRGLMPRRRRAG